MPVPTNADDAPAGLRPDRPIPAPLVWVRSLLRASRALRGRIQSFGRLTYGRNFMVGPGCAFLAKEHIRIGNNVSLGAHVVIESNVEIGDDTLISSQVAFVGNDHDFSDPQATLFTGRRLPASTVVIEGDCLIGFRSTLVGNIRIGRGCVVGAGSVVTRDLPPYSVCAGVPARKIRDRYPDLPAGSPKSGKQ
jgi:chloramphenicol O-acetyltransferase type B